MASPSQGPSGEGLGSGVDACVPASSHPGESHPLEMELDALELDGARATMFAKGRAAGQEAARRHGPVPDHVADAIATIITGDPAVRAAG